MFKTTNLAKSAVAAIGALVFSTVCLAGALAPSQTFQVAAHAVA